MKFNNRENRSHFVKDGEGDRWIWESRSVGVNGVVIIYMPGHKAPYALVSRRGPNSADFQNMMNLVAGYLDWDETGTEAIYREAWEEVGLDLKSFAYPDDEGQWDIVINNDLENPWQVKTSPKENRQNVSLRYGFACRMKEAKFPKLSLDHNEVDGEVSEAWWMPVSEIGLHKWAFNHDVVIKEYLVRIGDHISNYM